MHGNQGTNETVDLDTVKNLREEGDQLLSIERITNEVSSHVCAHIEFFGLGHTIDSTSQILLTGSCARNSGEPIRKPNQWLDLQECPPSQILSAITNCTGYTLLAVQYITKQV